MAAQSDNTRLLIRRGPANTATPKPIRDWLSTATGQAWLLNPNNFVCRRHLAANAAARESLQEAGAVASKRVIYQVVRLKRRRPGLKQHSSDRLPFTYHTTRAERRVGAPNLLWWAPDDTGDRLSNIELGERYADAFLNSDNGTYGYRYLLSSIISDIAEYGAGAHGVAGGFFKVVQSAALFSMDADSIEHLRDKSERERRLTQIACRQAFSTAQEVRELVEADKTGRIAPLFPSGKAVGHV